MADISKIKLPDGVTYDIKASSMATENVTTQFKLSKTAGHWIIDQFATGNLTRAYKCGNVVTIYMTMYGDGTNMTAGGTSYTGTLTKGYFPVFPTRAIIFPSTASAFAFLLLEEDGSITIRIQLGSINLSAGSVVNVSFTYITDGVLHT